MHHHPSLNRRGEMDQPSLNRRRLQTAHHVKGADLIKENGNGLLNRPTQRWDQNELMIGRILTSDGFSERCVSPTRQDDDEYCASYIYDGGMRQQRR